jgi:hypothetical protein
VLSALKSFARTFLPPSARARVRSWLDVLDTEVHYRTARGKIRRRLETLRRIPRGLHVEGTNICNARCVFCAYPQMERRKQTMPMEDSSASSTSTWRWAATTCR